MAHAADLTLAVIGFRVKSGRAVAVLLAGSPRAPQLVDRRDVDLCDPADPDTRQPYHAAAGTLETDEGKIDRRRKAVIHGAERSVAKLIGGYRDAGHQLRGAGLVVGSEIDPAKITNTHIRAHALEGQLFRTALEEALRTCGVTSAVIVEKRVYTRATEVLRRSENDLKQVLAALGRTVNGPWRADEKTAYLAAWLVLCDHAQKR